MSRLASKERAGFYPTPPAVTDLILSHIAAPQGGRILDPCAGEGLALAALAEGLGLAPYGIELHEGRAEAAREAVAGLVDGPASAHILADSYLNLITNQGGFNLLYLNPPYDHDTEEGRLEYKWLVRCRPWLQPGGLLVWVVPQHLLKHRKAARYLAAWYEEARVFRFPDGLFGRFRQIVLFGTRRAKAISPDAAQVEEYLQLAAGREALPPLAAAPEPVYRLPAPVVKDNSFRFRSQFVDPRTALAEARQVGARTTAAWREHLDPAAARVPLRPLTPLKIGHMNSIIASGHLNNQLLADGDERLLIKGRSYKVTRPETLAEPLPDGRIRQTHLETEVVMTDITTLDPAGQVTAYQGPALESFLERWITELAAIVAREYRPVYTFDMNGYGQLLSRLSKKRPIPGLGGRSGLLPAQKHAAAAILTRLERHPEAVAVGECGSGKAQPLDCKVLTPTGWKRMGDIQEGDEVIDPEGGVARVIGVYPQGKKEIFRVTFSDGAQTECCDEHLWQVFTPERRWRKQPPKLFELQQIKHKLLGRRNNRRYYIPLVKPVEFEEKSLPLDPYLLGALVGDGGLTQGCPLFSSADIEVLQEVGGTLPEEVSLKPQGKYDYRISGEYQRDSTGSFIPSNPATIALRELGLMGHRSETKFIPKRYLYASVRSRVALLQGLLDTDGTISRQADGFAGHMTYSTVSNQLAEDVTELIRSLGGTAKLTTRIPHYTHNGERRRGQLAYRVNIKLPEYIQPFRLTRKLERVIPRTKYGITRAMVKVEYVGEKEAQCIALDSENQLYVTDDYIVTHNTTIGAAVAAGRQARRTIVLCPPHLVAKWQREFKAVWPGVRTMHLKSVGDVDQFFGPQPDDAPLVGVLKQTTARAASGWEHAYDYGGPAGHNYGSRGFTDIRRPWGELLSFRDLASQAAAEEAAENSVELTAENEPPYPAPFGRILSEKQRQALLVRGVRCPVCGTTQFTAGRPLNVNELKTATRKCSNEQCRAPLYQFSRRRSESHERGSFKLYAERERLIGRYADQGLPVPQQVIDQWHGGAMRDKFGYAKVPLAGYIKKRARGRLDLLIVDEVHQCAPC